jgi:hypothetical protein
MINLISYNKNIFFDQKEKFMTFLHKPDKIKQKKDLMEELDFYKSIILKNLSNKHYKSASEKVNSAITLIKEFQDHYNLKKEHSEFKELEHKIKFELKSCQNMYYRRYNNLLKETLKESNLENFSKLLAMLKDEVDENINQYALGDLSSEINTYFKFINKLYMIVNSYKILNYHGASAIILHFVKEIKNENFPNIKILIFRIYQKLLKNQFYGFSKKFEKITLSELSHKLAINSDQLTNFINLIIKQPGSPIKRYNTFTHEIIFNK